MRFETYRDKAGTFRWRLVAENNRILADSGEGYENAEDRDHAIAAFRESAALAAIVEGEADRR